jgi:hypothetical protein
MVYSSSNALVPDWQQPERTVVLSTLLQRVATLEESNMDLYRGMKQLQRRVNAIALRQLVDGVRTKVNAGVPRGATHGMRRWEGRSEPVAADGSLFQKESTISTRAHCAVSRSTRAHWRCATRAHSRCALVPRPPSLRSSERLNNLVIAHAGGGSQPGGLE